MSTNDKAQDLLDSRSSVYGDRITNMDSAAAMVNAYMTGVNQREDTALKGYDFAMIMVIYKIYRFAVTPTYGDNIDDIEGYTKMVRECLGDDLVAARTAVEFAQKRNKKLKFPTPLKRTLCEDHAALSPYLGAFITVVPDSKGCDECPVE